MRTTIFDRETRLPLMQGLILLGLGLYCVYLLLSGHLDNYINMSFAWLTVMASALFLVMGIVSLNRVQEIVEKRRSQFHQHDDDDDDPFFDDHDHHHHDDHDHDHTHDDHHHHHGDTHRRDHSHVTWGMVAVVTIPLLLGVVVPSQPLSVDAINGGVSSKPVGSSSNDSSLKAPLERNILDWLRVIDQSSTATAFDGEPVDIVGFVYREPGFGDGAFMLSRFTLSCCVADAFAIGMPIIVDDATQFTDGTWLRIRGSLQSGSFSNRTMPRVMPDQIDIIDPPDSPYLYS